MTKFKKAVAEYEENTKRSFENVSVDMDYVLNVGERTRNEFLELRDELATNGVVRDLRKLEKLVAEQNDAINGLYNRFDDLGTNGVATAIKKLNAEVFKDKKQDSSGLHRFMYHLAGAEVPENVTLAGKVDAIIAHLGLDISVKPQEVVPAKVEVKKVKPVTKKKAGRR